MPHRFQEQYPVIGGDIVASGSASGSAGSFDLTGYEFGVYLISAHCETNGSVAFTPMEAATAAGSYTDVTATSGSVALPTITTANDDEVYLLVVPVASAKPFQKLYYAQSGAASTLCITAVGDLGGVVDPLPVTQENTVCVW